MDQRRGFMAGGIAEYSLSFSRVWILQPLTQDWYHGTDGYVTDMTLPAI
jgi:hypothetical protein